MAVNPCEQPGHEFVGNYGYDHEHHDRTGEWRQRLDKDEPCTEGGDNETHRVRILAPQEAIDANGQDELCCAGCAVKLGGAYIGFGWDVEVRDLGRT